MESRSCVQVVQLLHQLKGSAHIGSMLLPVHQVRHTATENKPVTVQQQVLLLLLLLVFRTVAANCTQHHAHCIRHSSSTWHLGCSSHRVGTPKVWRSSGQSCG
jgi:hypothetical protein